ncbi:TPA: hypothetical protein N0F65_004657 [Lagenidium giganteum]|uniref:CRAL-TRIO domain-containing protein n=1 Tax=Lagenidium giganteum TaxID=4803 RepID=A0AAV2ZG56_9STRA|nr:TPA: hypothetical protein N0F65_004657 [Lagenidium giganteum]
MTAKLAEQERERRLSEAQDREDEMAIVRQINIEYSITAAEQEQERRVREIEVAKVQDEIIRDRRKSEAIEAIEAERQRRISELDELRQQELCERVEVVDQVVQAVEQERVRRLSSAEHIQRMPSGSWSITKPADDVGTTTVDLTGALPVLRLTDGDATDVDHAGFSEIPVVNASSSKILVDEHTEWRCFISSEQPSDEKDKLHAMRTSLEDDIKAAESPFQDVYGDLRLLRFLRGNKMNVSVAVTKFREMMALRKKHNLDTVRKAIAEKNLTPEDFPLYNKIVSHLPFLNGYDLLDKDGNVLYFEMSGYADVRGLLENVTDEEWLEFFLYDMEYRAMRLDQLSRQNERLVQTVFVRDLTGFSIARFNPRLLKRLPSLLSIATKCYPETTSETLILHTPWIFHKVWNGIAAWLQETQLRKIHMGDDTYEHLLTLMGGRDRLPKLLGGKSTQHMIPQTGFLGRDSYVLLCEDGATQAEIRAGGVLQLPFRMAANDTICWEYEVKAHDVDFGVKLRMQGDGGAQEVEKIAKTRVMASQTICGSYTTTEEGTVVLSWDNSYSWTRSKLVAYKAKVVKATHDFSCLDISGNDCV